MLTDEQYTKLTIAESRRRRRKGLESARQQRIRRKRWHHLVRKTK